MGGIPYKRDTVAQLIDYTAECCANLDRIALRNPHPRRTKSHANATSRRK